jgi:hypothetical protein
MPNTILCSMLRDVSLGGRGGAKQQRLQTSGRGKVNEIAVLCAALAFILAWMQVRVSKIRV